MARVPSSNPEVPVARSTCGKRNDTLHEPPTPAIATMRGVFQTIRQEPVIRNAKHASSQNEFLQDGNCKHLLRQTQPDVVTPKMNFEQTKHIV
jgi:hypothetical protein